MRPRTVLIIGYVWPEPTSSAAGLRDLDLIYAFQRHGWKVVFASSCRENQFTETLRESGIEVRSILVNDPSFDRFISDLRPEVVIFDRFVTEEQFGWRVQEHSPETLRVVDTQDLHLLRRARREALDRGAPLHEIYTCRMDLFTEDALREVASIYRSDLSLIISDFEKTLLETRFQVPEDLLALARFSYPSAGVMAGSLPGRAFSEREGFAVIGNFRHPPNMDGVKWLKREIWPCIRESLPDARVEVFGAYPPKEVMQLGSERDGFLVRGWVENQFEALSKVRVNLAPLRYGAGIKGKITDGWCAGTPVVTTPIGSEGMHQGLPWGGQVAQTPGSFAEAAVALHESEAAWTEAAKNGRKILSELYDREKNADSLLATVELALARRQEGRSRNFVGAMLNHHLHRSTKFFSRWIEEKEKARRGSEPTST